MKLAENIKDIVGIAEVTVTQELTAAAVKSGLFPVYATPSMIALMEEAACNAMAPYYEEGEMSLGVAIDVQHLAATPVGQLVRATATALEQGKRKLVFDVQVYDVDGNVHIGTARHTRVTVSEKQFMEGLAKKA
jgi:Predicted thioesterase